MEGGKENDLKIELKNILYVKLPEVHLGFEIPKYQSRYTDEDWVKEYPNASAIYRIWGISPNQYVTKTRIK